MLSPVDIRENLFRLDRISVILDIALLYTVSVITEIYDTSGQHPSNQLLQPELPVLFCTEGNGQIEKEPRYGAEQSACTDKKNEKIR